MVSMYESIILCIIGTVIYESAAYDINKNICLERAVNFTNGRYRCNFYTFYAANILQDAGTCPSKCNVHIFNLNSQYVYNLHQVHVTIGIEQTSTQTTCQPSHLTSVSMHIECSSWKKEKYKVMNTRNCRLNNAHCDSINVYCVCHCNHGYIMVNGYCLKECIPLGGFCSHNNQCTGSEHAEICQNSRCTCSYGYTLIDFECKIGNITVNQPCLHNSQCTGTKFAGLCSSGVCTCQTGYMLIDNGCYEDHVPVGGFCSLDKQCTGSNNSETCDNRRCRCSDGHMLLDLECIQGNLSLNQSCIVNEQCSTSYYSRCVDGKCTCMDEYTAENLTNCIKFQPNEFEHSVRNYQDNNIGKILGTLFGGIFIGVILTAVIAFLIFQKIRTKIKKRDEPIVMFANDALYSSADVVEREDNTGFQGNDKKRQNVNVLPYICSEKCAVYSFLTRKPRIEQTTTDGVYNHLHQQEKHDNDDDDNYDHACAASYLGTEPSVYSNMP